jgi:hypothetical protein
MTYRGAMCGDPHHSRFVPHGGTGGHLRGLLHQIEARIRVQMLGQILGQMRGALLPAPPTIGEV